MPVIKISDELYTELQRRRDEGRAHSLNEVVEDALKWAAINKTAITEGLPAVSPPITPVWTHPPLNKEDIQELLTVVLRIEALLREVNKI